MILSTTRRLLTFVDRPRRSVGLLLAASLVAGLAEGGAILVVVRVAVDVASDKVSSDFVPFAGAPSSGAVALAIAASLALTTVVAHFVIAREAAGMSAGVLANSRSRALRAFTAARWSEQSTQRVGALQETVATLSAQSAQFAQMVAIGISNLIMLFMFLAVAAMVNPIGMGVISLAGGLIFSGLRPLTRRTRATGADYTEAHTDFAEETTGFASAAMELRAFGVGDTARRALEHDSAAVADKHRAVRFVSAFGTTLYRDVAVLMLIGSIAVLSLLDQSAVGSASAVVVLIVRSLGSAHAVNALVQSANERGATVDLLVGRIEALESAAEVYGDLELDSVRSIELRDVSYAYPGGDTALDRVSLSFTRGETIGIIGPSGGGKSTLTQLLLRLRRPTAGEIVVNGHDAFDYTPESWSRRVAVVPQEPSLFEGSIADNIAFHRPCTRVEIEVAAAKANIADEIERLHDGYDTVLGPGGSGLSGGQKQRVAIARAMIGAPDLLVMDEPSSALDPGSEALLRETIARLSVSTAVVIVAHRESTLEVCGRIVRIEAGRVTADVPRGSDAARRLHIDDSSTESPPGAAPSEPELVRSPVPR